MSMKRDLKLMLHAARSQRIPLVIGSCGGAGGEPHLTVVADIVREIAREDGLHFKLAVIHAEQDKGWVKRKLRKGSIKALRNVRPLDEETIDRATRIVGMMGPEPFIRALDDGAEVVLAGRSSDPAPWAGCATRAQLPPAPSWYAGKMLECGATAALPKGHDCLLTTVDREGIVLEAMNPIRICTPFSVANHSLHENSSPCFHIEPGGLLDTSDCTFEAVSDRAVRVAGMPDQEPTSQARGADSRARAITIWDTRPAGRHLDRSSFGAGEHQGGRLRRKPDITSCHPHLRCDGVMAGGSPCAYAGARARLCRRGRANQETLTQCGDRPVQFCTPSFRGASAVRATWPSRSRPPTSRSVRCTGSASFIGGPGRPARDVPDRA
jgi:hypothetical protein